MPGTIIALEQSDTRLGRSVDNAVMLLDDKLTSQSHIAIEQKDRSFHFAGNTT
jgi:hypothetical protein